MEIATTTLPSIHEAPSSSSPSKRSLQLRGPSTGAIVTKREKDMSAFNDAMAQVKEHMTDSQKAYTLLKQGRLVMDSGNYISAIDIFSEGISFTPTIMTLYTSRATCYKNIHKHTEAFYDYSFAIRLEPENSNLFCFRGLTLNKLKRNVMALEDMDEAVRLEPSAFNYFSRGTVYADGMKYDCAISDFDVAIADTNVSPDLLLRALYRKALTLFDLGSFRDAIPSLQQIIGIDTNHLASRVLYGKTLKNLSEFKLADDQLSIVITLEPKVALHYVERGDIRFQSKQTNLIVDSIADFNEAIDLYRELILAKNTPQYSATAATPSSSSSNRRVSSSNNLSSNINPNVEMQRKEQQQRQIVENRVLLGDTLYRRAQAKMMLDEVDIHTESALADISEAIALCPNEEAYQLLQAVCYLRARNVTKAKAALEPLVSDPNPTRYNERAMYHYSNCLRLEGRKKDAVKTLTYIIAKTQSRNNYDEGSRHSDTVPLSRVYEMRGIILQELHSHELALKDLSRSISLDPTKPDVLVLRGSCHCKLGNYEQALEDYSLAEERGADDMFSLLVSRGLICRMMGDYKRAFDDFSNAARHNTNTSNRYFEVRINILKALSFIDLDKYNSALNLFLEAERTMVAVTREYFEGNVVPEINNHIRIINNSNKMARESGTRDRFRRPALKGVAEDMPEVTLLPTDGEQFIFNLFHENIKIISKEKKNVIQKFYRILWILYYHQALAFYRLKRFDEASVILSKCTCDQWRQYECDEYSHGVVLFFLGVSLRNLGHLEEAEETLISCQSTAWAAVVKNLMLIQFALGKVSQMLCKYSEAVEYYTKTIEINANNAYAYFRRGWAYKSMRNYTCAGDDFETAKGMRPHDPNFSLEYKQVEDLDFLVVEQEPDSMELFPTILQVSGAFV